MKTVGSTEIRKQIFALGQMIEALAEQAHLGAPALQQEISTLFPPLVRNGLDGETSVTGSQVRVILRARRLRDQIFGSDLFADPAWDMLLDLMAARLERAQASVSSLCIAASVPPTTALRWIRHLTERGLLQRQADPEDGRRVFIELSNTGAEAMMRWLRDSRVLFAAAAGVGETPRGMAMLST